MLIHNQCWKPLCFLIFFATCDNFFMILKKVESLEKKENNCVTVYTTIQKFGSVNLFKKLILLFSKHVLNG